MTWPIAIILQIFASAIITLFTRRLSLSVKKVFFGVGVLSYLAIAVAGTIYSLTLGHQSIAFPPANVWPYLLIEGVCVPAAWLTQYKLISYIGASNAVIATTLNAVGAAITGIILLSEPLTATFVGGAVFILAGMSIALRIQPDDTRAQSNILITVKLGLVILGTILYAAGMFAEKVAVNNIGIWHYMMFGWGMQAIGAILIFAIFGRQERTHINRKIIRNGLLLGFITSVSGLLYIYALSLGSLSHTIIATSGKVAVVMVLAAIFLRERNSIAKRIIAFILAMIGLWFILA